MHPLEKEALQQELENEIAMIANKFNRCIVALNSFAIEETPIDRQAKLLRATRLAREGFLIIKRIEERETYNG